MESDPGFFGDPYSCQFGQMSSTKAACRRTPAMNMVYVTDEGLARARVACHSCVSVLTRYYAQCIELESQGGPVSPVRAMGLASLDEDPDVIRAVAAVMEVSVS